MVRLSEALAEPARNGANLLAQVAAGNRVIVLLVAAALLSRLTLLSVSLDEVDSANFFNALRYGYDIGGLRPHAPGYPVYVFMGWLLDAAIDDPLRRRLRQ